MKTTLREVITEQGVGRQTLLLDVACGGGRYVETLRSGLHELSDDGLTKHHFVQLGGLLGPGGTFLYTVQPHHPRLELIARTLNSHTGGSWVIRLCSAELIRSWAEAGGFGNFKTQTDTQNIFGVVRARKL